MCFNPFGKNTPVSRLDESWCLNPISCRECLQEAKGKRVEGAAPGFKQLDERGLSSLQNSFPSEANLWLPSCSAPSPHPATSRGPLQGNFLFLAPSEPLHEAAREIHARRRRRKVPGYSLAGVGEWGGPRSPAAPPTCPGTCRAGAVVESAFLRKRRRGRGLEPGTQGPGAGARAREGGADPSVCVRASRSLSAGLGLRGRPPPSAPGPGVAVLPESGRGLCSLAEQLARPREAPSLSPPPPPRVCALPPAPRSELPAARPAPRPLAARPVLRAPLRAPRFAGSPAPRVHSLRHGGQRERERYRRGGRRPGSHAVVLLGDLGRQRRGRRREVGGHCHLAVPPGGAHQPPGLAAAGEQGAEDRAGDLQTQVQGAAGGEPRPAQSQRDHRECTPSTGWGTPRARTREGLRAWGHRKPALGFTRALPPLWCWRCLGRPPHISSSPRVEAPPRQGWRLAAWLGGRGGTLSVL